MKLKQIILGACAVMALSPAALKAQILYSENFDVNHTSGWTVNSNFGGATNAANFFFDYSTVGIPSAPNSGGSTTGLKLGANLLGVATPAASPLAGISVSPTGQGFTGNYTVKFDWWQNWLGAVGAANAGIGASAGGSGSTQLSTFGVLSSGTTASYAGATDGVFFGATGDGASATDFRAYSSGAQAGYAVGNTTNTYAAGSQNSSAALYQTLFPAGKTAPGAQITISSTQTNSTLAGTAGFAWHNVEIIVSSTNVLWKVDGTLLDTLDTTGLNLSGTNILFGMSDTSTGAGTPASLFQQLDFTLIDNINVFVTPVPEPAVTALVVLGAAGLCLIRRRRQT